MTSDAEHLFMGLLAMHVPPLEECLFEFFAHFFYFLTESSAFSFFSGKHCLHILEAFVSLYRCS